MITQLTDETFEDYINSEIPTLVDFWAEWCGPCKMMEPVLEQYAGEQSESLRVAKVNIDLYPEMMCKFGIMGIPTMILFAGGNRLKTVVGATTKVQLEDFLKEAIDEWHRWLTS